MTVATTEIMMGPQDMLQTLTRGGCQDITGSINANEATDMPLLGGGIYDVYFGKFNNNIPVAIKSLRFFMVPNSENQKVLKTVAREICVWSKLHDPNVLQLLGITRFRGTVALVTPWTGTGSILDYLEQRPHVNRFLLCSQLASGLEYLHRHHVVHGDIKASNVLILDGVVKIANVGISGLKDYLLQVAGTNSPGASIRWTAPEILDGSGTQSYASDVWSWGMTALEIITSKVPFFGKLEPVVIMDVMVRRMIPSRPDSLNLTQNEMGERLWELLVRCWSYDSSSRPTANQINATMPSIRQKGQVSGGGKNT